MKVFLDDASSGLNAVLRSLPWQPQDVMLLTSAAYAVLPNTGKWLQKRYGIQILQAEVYHGCKHEAWQWIVWIGLAEDVYIYINHPSATVRERCIVSYYRKSFLAMRYYAMLLQDEMW